MNWAILQFMEKLREDTNYHQNAMNYVYRLISADRTDVAFKILTRIAKSASAEYREPIGYSILEIVKRLKSGPNAIPDIERIFQVIIF